MVIKVSFNMDKVFMQKRDEIVTMFSTLCVRPLEHCFVRPLLASLDLLDDYLNTLTDVEGNGQVLSKLQVLFTSGPQAAFLRRGIVESCGVNNFNVLFERVQDIVGGIVAQSVDFDAIDDVFNFGGALDSARAYNIDVSREPVPFLFLQYVIQHIWAQ